MATWIGHRAAGIARPLRESLATIPAMLLQPVRLFRSYQRRDLRADLTAGLTVAVILLPQAIAYALIAELPPQTGLYAAVVSALVAALWGSSSHLQTGPTNALSLLMLSVLLPVATPGSSSYVLMAGFLALFVGVIQVAMGFARLGVLVNFVSHSVIVGFSAGAGILIAATQVRHLLGLEFSSHGLMDTLQGVARTLPQTHVLTTVVGLGTIVLIVVLRRVNRKWPGPLIAMVAAAAVVGLGRLDRQGIAVVGELPRGLPPVLDFSHLHPDHVGHLAVGALAIAAHGLVEAMSIARSIASQSRQRLNSNQEFLGQGLANIAAGLFTGYPCSGSFTRSATNFAAGARTRLAGAFSGLFVLLALLALGPAIAYVPRAALAGVLMLIAVGMIDFKQIARTLRGARADALIIVVTFLATLFLHLEAAVLIGIALSFVLYIIQTSVPRVVSVVPDTAFRYLVHQPEKPTCPQLGVLDILGDIYFGAVSHVERAIAQHLAAYPSQRFLLLRMDYVQHCDFSGIHALESLLTMLRERGGDLFMTRVSEPTLALMRSTGLCAEMGDDHLLDNDAAIPYLFHHVLDPAVCIYECDRRVFWECQNLPKSLDVPGLPQLKDIPAADVAEVEPRDLWQHLHGATPPLVIDVREPREFRQSHIPGARAMPLGALAQMVTSGAPPEDGPPELPRDRPIVLACLTGRRSTRAASLLLSQGYEEIAVLKGGVAAWEAANLLTAVDVYADLAEGITP